MAEHPAPTDAEFDEAAATAEPILKQVAVMNEAMQQISPVTVGLIQFLGMWFLFVALGGLIAAIAFRRGLILVMFGVDCATRRGALASRPRMLWRSIVFNAPVVLAPIVVALVAPLGLSLVASLLTIVGAIAVITVWSSLLPARGLADRLSERTPYHAKVTGIGYPDEQTTVGFDKGTPLENRY